MQVLTFDAGEIRRLEWTVSPQKANDTIVITSATWEMTENNMTIDSGECTVDGNRLSAVISFNDVGLYNLKITVTVPPEIIVENLVIRVL